MNFNFEIDTWVNVDNYGMENFLMVSSKENEYFTVNYTSVPSQYEKINLPLTNLEVGALYQLTFTTRNDNTIITSDNAKTLVYGCTVMDKPATDYLNPKALIAYDGYNSGFIFKTLKVSEQTSTLTFRATKEIMYWVWDLSLIEDQDGTLYVYDIDIKKSITPDGAYVDVPNASIYQKESLAVNETSTLIVEKGTFITKADYDNLVVNVQTAAGFEFINIPIVNLTVGKSYTLSFKNNTTDGAKASFYYGSLVQTDKREGGGQLVGENDFNITDLRKVNVGEITFTASSNTMYWVWDLGGLSDGMWPNINIYDISLVEN